MKNVTYYLFLSVLLISCTSNVKFGIDKLSPLDTISVDMNKIQFPKMKCSEFFERIEYIQAPYDSIYCIGKINKLIVADSILCVVDQKISRSIYVLDRNGNPKVVIDKTGTASGEYVCLRDVFIDEVNNEILVYCIMRHKVIHYGFDGKFLYEEEQSNNALRIENVGENQVLYMDYFPNESLKNKRKYPNLLLREPMNDSNQAFANYYISTIPKSNMFTSEPQFSKLNDTLYSIKPDHCNTIYHVTPHQIYPAYQLDFGPYNLDEEFWEMASKKRMKFKTLDEYSDNRRFCETFRFLEGKDFLYFVCKQRKTVTHVFYSKKTKTLKQIAKFENDMDYVTVFRPIAMHDDKLYCLLDSEEVYNMKEELTGVLPDTILENVQEFGNPIIAMFTLKPF